MKLKCGRATSTGDLVELEGLGDQITNTDECYQTVNLPAAAMHWSSEPDSSHPEYRQRGENTGIHSFMLPRASFFSTFKHLF